MDDAKRIYREGEQKVKETLREVDGHDAGDDIGNAGDAIRKELGNAGDDMHRADEEAARQAERANSR
jgi:hypothetical protein